jgi:hypothetical protein
MLYREIIAVCSEIHTKHKNTLCGRKVDFLNVKRGGTYSNHCGLKVEGSEQVFKRVFKSLRTKT